jgi:Family of unknown function (DUF6459)
MPSLPSPQESLARANVIKWAEVLPRSRNMVAAPAQTASRPTTLARRRQRPVPGPPPGFWPLPASRPRSPLPDPALARRCAVPDPAPPYDEDPQTNRRPRQADGNANGRPAAGRGAQAGVSGRAGPRQFGQAGQYGQTGSGRRDAVDGTERQASVGTADGAGAGHQVDPERQADTGRVADPGQRADTGSRGDPGQRADDGRLAGGDGSARPAWPSQFAQVLAETLAGSRPPRQLTPWTTERARGHIRRLGPLLAASQEPRIRRIVACTPSSGVVEMAVVVRFGPRVRALALRLERGDSSHVTAWQCTAIEAA